MRHGPPLAAEHQPRSQSTLNHRHRQLLDYLLCVVSLQRGRTRVRHQWRRLHVALVHARPNDGRQRLFRVLRLMLHLILLVHLSF